MKGSQWRSLTKGKLALASCCVGLTGLFLFLTGRPGPAVVLAVVALVLPLVRRSGR